MQVPSRRADLAHRRERAAVDADLGAARRAAGARAQHEVRHRRDARQRLAAEAERADRAEIVRRRDLARRVPLDRQPRVLRLHPLAVVFDADQLLAAELDRDRDARGAGVDRVLDQLLDDRRRPLDDLAGGDLVGEVERAGGGCGLIRSSPCWRKNASIAAATAPTIIADDPPELRRRRRPGKCGSVDVHAPHAGQHGQRQEDRRDHRQHLHDLFSWFETADRCASRMPVTRSWKNIASSDEPHQVIVDVAEAVGHLLGDQRKLAPRQAADRVALRQHHAAQRRHVALERRGSAAPASVRLSRRPRSSSLSSRSSSSSISGR